jgi:hypothetical protein
MTRKRIDPYLVLISALILFASIETCVNAQSSPASFSFKSGQALYIVAYCRGRETVVTDPETGVVTPIDYTNIELGAESKIRTKLEEWRFFRIAEKPSDADFVFLINLDDSAMEGLAIPFDAYRQHFKEKFDLDALREAAHGRYLAGPLKLPTLGRLSDRLVKDFRAKVSGGASRGK